MVSDQCVFRNPVKTRANKMGNVSTLSLALLWFCAIFAQWQVAAEPIFIDPAVELVTWEGWGTSLCWWPDVLGAMPEDVIEAVTRAFFSPDELNLNIVRYTIGATTPGQYVCGPYRAGGATESFLDGPDESYDWTRDPRQRRIMLLGKELGVDTFEAFSNSPPAWMTISGCSKGNDNGAPLHNNFDVVNASAFADYATEVIRHYHEEWNVTFQSYAPYNEPSGYYGNGYWKGSQSSQEGCSMTYEVMAEVLKAMDASLRAKNMDYVKLTIADETVMNLAAQTHEFFYEQGLTSLAEKINTHGYSDDGRQNRDLLYIRANRDGLRLWMDEIGWSEGAVGEMDQGLTIAERIITDIRELLPSAWVYWQALEDAGAWGLLGVPYNDPSVANIRYNSGFYAMKQLSKYIKKGSKIIYIKERYAVAAFDAANKVLTVVILNQSDQNSDENTYDLTLFTSPTGISATRTSKFEKNVAIDAPTLVGSTFTMSALRRSVTTLVFTGVEAAGEAETEFVNGGFEGGLEGWNIAGGPSDGGVQGEYAFRGSSAAFLNATSGDIRISQSFVIPSDGRSRHYFLTAWCRTTGGSATLGIRIVNNGHDIAFPTPVWSDNNYGSFGLSFAATSGDTIEVFFEAARSNSIAYIDEIVLSKIQYP